MDSKTRDRLSKVMSSVDNVRRHGGYGFVFRLRKKSRGLSFAIDVFFSRQELRQVKEKPLIMLRRLERANDELELVASGKI